MTHELKIKTIWRAHLVSYGYAGESRWWGGGDRGLMKDKLFESRTAAEKWLEPQARQHYEWALSDTEANEGKAEAERLKAEYDRLGGFQMEQKEDQTIFWGPKPEHEDCREGCNIASVVKDELVLDE